MGRNWRELLVRSKESIRLACKESLARIGLFSRPSFLIIGAQKGGTAALYRYLSVHPDIVTGQNEIGFFHRDKAYHKGNAWYHSHFPLPRKFGQHIVTFESTPEYLYYPACTKRILSYDPQIKLIVLLRDPVERAFSAWVMFRDIFFNHRGHLYARLRLANDAVRKSMEEMLSTDTFPEFDETVRREIREVSPVTSAPEPSYVRRGLYAEQLQRYFEYFARDQILILDSRSLKHATVDTLHKVIRFLGLPEYDWGQEPLSLHHIGKYNGVQMSDQIRAFLHEFYRPHNQRLYELLGRDFGW
jgi:hypothetical protein